MLRISKIVFAFAFLLISQWGWAVSLDAAQFSSIGGKYSPNCSLANPSKEGAGYIEIGQQEVHISPKRAGLFLKASIESVDTPPASSTSEPKFELALVADLRPSIKENKMKLKLTVVRDAGGRYLLVEGPSDAMYYVDPQPGPDVRYRQCQEGSK